MPGMNDPGSIGLGRVGIGSNFAKARLILAKRAGYLPSETQIDPTRAPQQWKSASANLARDSRAAGFSNPLMYLRTGAVAGGKIPRPTAMRPGGSSNPAHSLAYSASQLAAVSRQSLGAQAPATQPGVATGAIGNSRGFASLLNGITAAQATGLRPPGFPNSMVKGY